MGSELFWAKVEKGPGCWPWIGTSSRNGYGRVWFNGKMHQAHRLAYELTVGPIPESLFACHHCDNRICVRPDHIFLGDHRANALDMIAKGRARHQKAITNSKLNWEQVNAIREAAATGEPYTSIAKRFGVYRSTASLVARGKTWTERPVPVRPGVSKAERRGTTSAPTVLSVREKPLVNANYGEHNGAAKLTWEEVEQIRDAAVAGETYRGIGRRFGIHHGNVRLIVEGKTWKVRPLGARAIGEAAKQEGEE